ncbi:hypothetical protein RJ639_016615 [Escallonia herrerae]|uniref:Uncharacterized protein n=1 Tax=Escallonia herrerae TaxID=1293975 RepID=A0AA89AL50_9ASTE|nr:hypothetical protein RJ639_016615 [Escallonia herrerae]
MNRMHQPKQPVKGEKVYAIAHKFTKCRKNLSEDANAAFDGDFSQEEIIRQQPFLEASELEQPPEHRRLLQLKVPVHYRSRYLAGLDRRRDVLGNAVQRSPNLGQRQDRLPPVSLSGISSFISAAAATVASSAAVTAAISGGKGCYGSWTKRKHESP